MPAHLDVSVGDRRISSSSAASTTPEDYLMKLDGYEQLRVDSACSLREFIVQQGKQYERKSTYYELVKEEDICDQEVVVMNKVSNNVFCFSELTIVLL